MLSHHFWVGRINEPRNARESGLYPEGTGDLDVRQAPEVTWSDLHFGKVSLIWVGRLGCRGQEASRG